MKVNILFRTYTGKSEFFQESAEFTTTHATSIHPIRKFMIGPIFGNKCPLDLRTLDGIYFMSGTTPTDEFLKHELADMDVLGFSTFKDCPSWKHLGYQAKLLDVIADKELADINGYKFIYARNTKMKPVLIVYVGERMFDDDGALPVSTLFNAK